MRYSNLNYRTTGEVIDLGGGVTYEMPLQEKTVYRKVVDVVNLGDGVTYELTSYVPIGNASARYR